MLTYPTDCEKYLPFNLTNRGILSRLARNYDISPIYQIKGDALFTVGELINTASIISIFYPDTLLCAILLFCSNVDLRWLCRR